MEEMHLKELYVAYSDSIYYYLARRSGSEEVAFDLMQDTFVRAGIYYKNVENPKAWLFMIARNILIDYMKDAKKNEGSSHDETLTFMNLASAENIEDNVNWKILKSNILKKLDEENKILPEIFLLRLDYELTHKEIAEVVNIPFRTIRRYFEKIRNIIYNNFKDELDIKDSQNYGQAYE